MLMKNTKQNYVDILKPIRIVSWERSATLHMDKWSLESLMILLIQNYKLLQISCSYMKIVIKIIVELMVEDISNTSEVDLMVVVDSEEEEVEVEEVEVEEVVVDTNKEIDSMDMVSRTKVVTITKL